MSDTLGQQPTTTEGSVSASAGLGAAGSQQAPTPNSSWLDSLDEPFRNDPTIRSIKAENSAQALNALANMTVNAQKLVGVEKIPALKPDMAQEAKVDWFQKYLGVPKDPSGYQFIDKFESSKDDNGEPVLSDIPPELTERARKLAHGAQLTPSQASEMYNAMVADHFTSEQSSQESLRLDIIKQMGELHNEWGAKFDSNMEVAKFAYERILPESLQEKFSEMPELLNNPDFIKMFEKIGRGMADDSIRGGSGSNDPSVSSPAQAISALRSLEGTEEWRSVLSGNADSMTTERLRMKREQLYRQAYPSE